ncbi:MAG: hypothetical protein EKK56_06940 [Flavobacteriaceae bacterium]|nr:MAG: hypothetical protein EKK56_06940 [Flavobacteriaceae bacterium]
MKKALNIITIVLFFFSCAEKEKTYEELEAEVLCDVLPEVIPEIGSLFIPPPPPPPDSLQNENFKISSDEEFLKLVNEEKEKIKKLAKQKNKYRIGIIDTLRGIDFTYYKNEFPKHFNDFKPIFDSLDFRQINKNEVKNSTLLINLYGSEFLPHLTSNHKHDEHTIVSISRVVINDKKDIAFFNLTKGGCVPYAFKIISIKKNNKWILKGIIKDDY